FEITVVLRETETGLSGSLEYDADLFDADTMAQMLRHFRALLEAVVRDPAETIATVPLLSGDDRQLLLQEWNHTATIHPRDMAIHHLFAEQVQRSPQAIALVSAQGEMTYAELDRRANRIARRLVKLGAGPERLVGVSLARSPEMIVSLLGI